MEKEVKKEISEHIAESFLSGCAEFTFREGKALDLKEPLQVNICGTIDAPARWLETRNRINMINQKSGHIIVNREQLMIMLKCDENNAYGSTITGKLEESEEYKKFGINGGEYITSFEMAESIKMNRTFFENRQFAMNLVTQLRNFKAKVDKDLEHSDDTRGNRKILVNQIVESNLPEAFSLIIPVFKGQEKQKVECEVYVNPDDFTCTLVSPEANDIIQEERDDMINSVLQRINLVCPDIVIIEQ